MHRLLLLIVLLLAGCGGDAVVFAPTPSPPDLSPTTYTHPAGAFSLVVPRTWNVYEINTTVLAATAFSRPDAAEPALTAAVINLAGAPTTSEDFAALLDRYQSQVRPDVETYTEQNRQAMGDGSWRVTGIRRLAGGEAQPVNTFVQQAGSRLAVIDVVMSKDSAEQAELQRVINTLHISPDSPLEATDVSALSSAKPNSLALLHLFSWTTPQGIFFITGEVANYGVATVMAVPIRAVLYSSDGLAIVEAADRVMGYGIPAGGFAPFSLRFGQGQPASARDFSVFLGGEGWPTEIQETMFPTEQLVTEDESSFDNAGHLIIRGEVENTGSAPARSPRAIVTVFDAAQNVIAAGFIHLSLAEIPPGGRAPYEFVIQELGGEPINYIVVVQAT